VNDPNEVYDQWVAKQEAMGRRIVPEDQRAPIPEVYGIRPPRLRCSCGELPEHCTCAGEPPCPGGGEGCSYCDQ